MLTAATLNEYTATRSVDAKAIVDLAFYNYIEVMKCSISKKSSKLAKPILNDVFPTTHMQNLKHLLNIQCMYFYSVHQMRASVNSRMFLLRKKLDNFLYWLFPNMWMPLYTSVRLDTLSIPFIINYLKLSCFAIKKLKKAVFPSFN